MPAGAGLGGLAMVLLPLVGIATILKARAARKRGEPPVDEDFEARRAATLEAERRMAAYLASRDSRE
ncbi:hypothetical protein [Tabrizicola sp.]|uniref:hypothetical protein n=1 Tax=Tabrizicola sp. TaxID=2005166 RepID=UPI0027333531|nr:hypothetical protein [Tabrizicola sp.]MDP3194495.1 hypothetical protein [Tabrizicola sp.]